MDVLKYHASTMAEIFVTRRFFDDAIEKLQNAGHDVEVNDSDRSLAKNELIENVSGKDGLICLLNDIVDEEVLDVCSSLQVVSNVAVGYDNIDIDAASRHGVQVTNTPGVLTETTADLTFALLLSAARRIPEADTYVRADRYDGWELMQPHLGVDVHQKTLGVWGMGRIGKAVAQRAYHGFDMDIIYNSNSPKEAVEESLDADFVPFEELLQRSQFLTIHTPITPETEGTFDAEAFKSMREDAILINVARGQIVDEAALVNALQSGELRGAALDTFEAEPAVNEQLTQIEESVVLTPHIGSASRETRSQMAHMAVENMLAGLAGETPPNLVNERDP